MSRLDPKVVVHRLSITKSVSLKSNHNGVFALCWYSKLKKEINKLIEAGFIREVKHPTWIANIIW